MLKCDCVLLITRLLLLVGRLSARKPVYHSSRVAVVTPTDRPKSAHNRCVINVLVAFFELSCCIFDLFCGCRAFVIGLSQISSYFLNSIVVISNEDTSAVRSGL